MFDTHHDLLSIAYKAYLTKDYSYLGKISQSFTDNNVKGVIANLYFMSKEEMQQELCSNYYQEKVSVLEMFKKAKEILDLYLPDTEIVYSIEGADFIKDPQELEELYNAGLDALILCWNTESKYGSGNRSQKGLTEEGEALINKAIDLGMGIDLSHANKETFNDLVNLIQKRKNQGVDVCCYASHSNSRVLCDRDRNLDDEQLKKIGKIGALVGLFALKNFTIRKDCVDRNSNYNDAYLDHIKHIGEIIGYSNIMSATDDMMFCADVDIAYVESGIYKYEDVGKKLYLDLLGRFGIDIASEVIYDNAKNKIYNKLKENRNKKIGVK